MDYHFKHKGNKARVKVTEVPVGKGKMKEICPTLQGHSDWCRQVKGTGINVKAKIETRDTVDP